MIDVLFVCYGNICRSPTAEAMLDAHLLKLLGPGHDVVIASAGVGAMEGLPPTEDAVAAARDRGIDMGAHRSQPVTPQLVRRAKRIYCMERSQVEELRALVPGPIVDLLGDGVEDPIGCSRWVYDGVADKIDKLVRKIAEEITAERKAKDGTNG